AFFFFQAEDGIRDFHVTGVQTCALPIWTVSRGWCRTLCTSPSRTPSSSRPNYRPRTSRSRRSANSSIRRRRSRASRGTPRRTRRSEEHTSELQSRENLVCRLLLEKKKHK